MRKSNYRKKIKISPKARKLMIGSVTGALLVMLVFFFTYFHVDKVEVMGCSYYTEEEIKQMVLRGPLSKNAVLAPMLYSKEGTDDIHYIKAIDVSQVNNHTICISVEEIQPVGCFKYLDCYMYFDRKGVIIASSVERNVRIPFFKGLQISKVAFGDEVPFSDESMLNTSISLSRIFAKSDDVPDDIAYDESGNITLIYGDITARLGKDKYLEDKMTRLLAILPKIAGQKGILHLENVNDNKKVITFEKENFENAQDEEIEDSEKTQEDSEDESYDGGSDNNYDSSYDSYDSDSSYDSDYDSNSDSSYDSSSENSSENNSEDSSDSGSDSSYDSNYDSGYDSGYDSSSDDW